MNGHTRLETKNAFIGSFTVLMAVYHKENPQRFDQALTSIFANSLAPDKILLIVDGPLTDALEAVLARHQEQQASLKVHRLPKNRGLAQALNIGLSLIDTEWVARADSDDLNHLERFAKQAAAIAAADPPLDLLGSAIQEVDFDGTPLAVRRTVSGHQEICKFAARRNPFNHMTVWYRAALAREVGGYPDIHLKEDYALWASIIHAGGRCENLSEVLVYAVTGKAMYRRRGGRRYAMAELLLQRHLHKVDLKSAFQASFDGFARAVVFLMPSNIREIIYINMLRTSNSSDHDTSLK
jgi:glycosyltransferase involved in cell wall biosynthesis